MSKILFEPSAHPNGLVKFVCKDSGGLPLGMIKLDTWGDPTHVFDVKHPTWIYIEELEEIVAKIKELNQ